MANPITALPSNVVAITNHQVKTTSLKVAEHFGKRHADVLRKIESLDCSPEFTSTHFCVYAENIQAGAVMRESKYYEITKDGFMFLVMGFTGKKAAMIKEAYIHAFNEMERQLHAAAKPEQKALDIPLIQDDDLLTRAFASSTNIARDVQLAVLESRLHQQALWEKDSWMFYFHTQGGKGFAADIGHLADMLGSMSVDNATLAKLAAACNAKLAKRLGNKAKHLSAV